MLSGYKTYITAGVAIVGAVAGYLTGDVSMSDAAQLVVTALLGAFLRNGVAKA
ncbi:hypothetical protein [Synechococcus phage Ssp-JY42]|nr:hypothetical protein [Synechococcus phage Yong-M4-211]